MNKYYIKRRKTFLCRYYKLLFFCLLYCNTDCFSQTLKGLVVDENGCPIPAVTIVIQKVDSTETKVNITQDDGTFIFQDIPLKYRLIASHISFTTKVVTDTVLYKIITLQENKNNTIGEVVITAPIRQLKMTDNGALLFDANTIMKTHPTSNVMDLLEGIPTVQKTGDDYTLIGTSSTNITINGRKSSLTQEQIKSQLISMSPERVKNIEIFYNTPAKYGIKGASININLIEHKTEHLHISGDVSLNSIFRHHVSYGGNGNIQLTSKKVSANIGYALSRIRKKSVLDMVSEHTVNFDLFSILQQTTTSSKSTEHKLYADFHWKPTIISNLSLSYSANLNKPEIGATAITTIEQNIVKSRIDNSNNSYLHNLSSIYKYKTFDMGCDFSFYAQKENQVLNYTSHVDIIGLYKQKFLKTRAYMNNETDIHIGKLEFGIDYSYSTTKNTKYTNNNEKGDKPFKSDQNEHCFSFYIGFNKQLGGEGFIDVSIQGEYFKSTIDSVNVNKTMSLWNTFNIYPKFTFLYKLSDSSSMQIAFNSQNYYPSYWITASNRTYINNYCANEGSPQIKPYTKYALNLNYILRSKYIFGAFYEYCDNYYTQCLFQNDKELIAIYKYFNMNFNMKIGVMSVIPIKWTSFASSRFTGILFSMTQKGKIENISFNKENISSRLAIVNTLNLIRKTLSIELSGWYQFPTIQGLYDVNAMYSASMGLTWRTGINGLSVVVKGEDIFNTYRMKVSTNIDNQNYSFKNNVDQRFVSLTIKYNFNDYKLKRTNRYNDRLGF